MNLPRPGSDNGTAHFLSAHITPTELDDYRQRLALVQRLQIELHAAQAYLLELQKRIQKAYSLPDQYELSVETGEVRWVMTAMQKRIGDG